MRILEELAYAAQFAANQWQAARLAGSEEEKNLWLYVRGQRDFVQETGQVYRFEDYLRALPATAPPPKSATLSARVDTASHRAMRLLLEALQGAAHSPDQKRHAIVLLALLNFIADTGQSDDAEDYFNNRPARAPLAIAHFRTRDEAEAWLKEIAEPPSPAAILIGDEYFLAWYSREDAARGMYRDYILETHLEGLVAEGIPPSAPSFGTRAEAETWLASHPAAPYAFVSISKEYYLAVHHERLKRHTLHHVASTLKAWEERKRGLERRDARDSE
ncbi:MAG TPA: hypothetical protein VLQ93_21165 [Myxococcaceae bacterium]|nr:hypothetical protein [Myxococcaceae bacterium]